MRPLLLIPLMLLAGCGGSHDQAQNNQQATMVPPPAPATIKPDNTQATPVPLDDTPFGTMAPLPRNESTPARGTPPTSLKQLGG